MNIYLFNTKSCQKEIYSFFYQVRAVKCAVFKACTEMFMLKCTAAAFLSCRSLHRVRVVCYGQGIRHSVCTRAKG